MTRDVVIKVLQHHIDEGQPGVMMACPIALALAEALPGHTASVSYYSTSVWAPDGTLAGFVPHPWEVRMFIENFDEYGLSGRPRDHFRPFTTVLTLSDEPVRPWRVRADRIPS